MLPLSKFAISTFSLAELRRTRSPHSHLAEVTVCPLQEYCPGILQYHCLLDRYVSSLPGHRLYAVVHPGLRLPLIVRGSPVSSSITVLALRCPMVSVIVLLCDVGALLSQTVFMHKMVNLYMLRMFPTYAFAVVKNLNFTQSLPLWAQDRGLFDNQGGLSFYSGTECTFIGISSSP